MKISWSRLRRLVQLSVLVGFVLLTVGGAGLGRAWMPTDPFSQLDPLVGLSAVIASRALIAFWAAALLTVAFAVLFGRAWCGWICPLGTILDFVRLPTASKKKVVSPRWRLGKYVTLAIVLGAALIGNLAPMILDPITVITRPVQEIARPLLGSDALGQSVGADIGRSTFYSVALLSLLPLIIVVALNAVDRRFWCRNLCPLGGLLALLSKAPGVRRRVDAEVCTSCGCCAKACPTAAMTRGSGFASDSMECIACLECVDVCKAEAISFGLGPKPTVLGGYEPTRRDMLIAAGAAGLGLVAWSTPLAHADAEILRPPSTSEERLAQLCVRCGACYGACPTGSLRPSISFTSRAGPWTPMLDERPAHCTMKCNKCAAPCPTDALHTPTPAEAELLGLGVKAEVNRERCRAWARNHACMQCQSVCPIAGALVGQERPAGLPRENGSSSVQVPVVNTDLCIGCDLCAAACVMSPPAIGAPLPAQPSPSEIDGPPFRMPQVRPKSSASGTTTVEPMTHE